METIHKRIYGNMSGAVNEPKNWTRSDIEFLSRVLSRGIKRRKFSMIYCEPKLLYGFRGCKGYLQFTLELDDVGSKVSRKETINSITNLLLMETI